MKSTDVTRSIHAGEQPVEERLTYDVPEAGRLLGLSRTSAYAAAKSGLIPVLNFGGRMLVPKAALHQMLAAAGAGCQRAHEAAAKSEVNVGSSMTTVKGLKGPSHRRASARSKPS